MDTGPHVRILLRIDTRLNIQRKTDDISAVVVSINGQTKITEAVPGYAANLSTDDECERISKRRLNQE